MKKSVTIEIIQEEKCIFFSLKVYFSKRSGVYTPIIIIDNGDNARSNGICPPLYPLSRKKSDFMY